METLVDTIIPQVSGRLLGIELQNFMCHKNLKLNFDILKCNCFYIIGSNGSGKSALFAGINIGLGGKGRSNDRGNSLKAYIKEGEKNAKIRVILSNEGTNALFEYGKEIIIERLITENSNSFVIKTKKKNGVEEIKSRKKADLDQVLHRFSIELDNPLSWLSQDRSRQFLQQMKPEKLYNIFMISTELESTERIYENILCYIEETISHIKAGEEKKQQLKNQYEKMRDKFKAGFKIEELLKMKSKLQWLLLWAEIRDNNELLNTEIDKLDQLAIKKATFEKEIVLLNNQKELLTKEKGELLDKVGNYKNELCETKSCFDNLCTKSSRCERDLNNAAKLLEQKKTNLKSVIREIQETQIQLDRLIGSFNADLIGEEKKLLSEKKKNQNEISDLEKELEDYKNEEKKLFDLKKQKIEEYNKSEFELKQDEEKLQGICKDKETCLLARKNRLALLGSDIPKICQLIQKNSELFEKKPIGPIGLFVKLKDSKWANPVEFCLRKSLSNFICNSPHDRQIFEKICRENRVKIPDLITTQFVDKKVCTEENEPPLEFNTILRMIDIENCTVYNALVDQLSLEDFLLIENDDDARKIMRQNPPKNARQALTMRCSNVFPASGNRPYRFYCNSNVQNARFLVDDSNLNKRDFTLEIKQINLAINEKRKIVEEKLKNKNKTENDYFTKRDNRKLLEKKKDELEQILKNLDEKYQNLQKLMNNGPVIENLKAVLQENQQIKEKSLHEVENAEQNLLKLNEEKKNISTEIDKTKEDLKKIDDKLKNLNKVVSLNSTKIDEIIENTNNINSKLNKCETLRLKFENTIKEYNEKDTELRKKCESEKHSYLIPEDCNDPPDTASIYPTEFILAKLEDYNKQIFTQQQINKNDTPTKEQLEKLFEICKIHNAKLKKFRSYLNRFKEAVAIRQEKLNILKFALPHNLARSFKEHMLMRNFNGLLVVDHENKVITLKVETHKKKFNDNNTKNITNNDNLVLQKNQKVVQDLKGLSGGERSFTTACFVMALWECVDSPFRCLDEFDVFMDMLNRRVVMEMLVDLAMEHKKNQFFFFTPQGITELKNRHNIEIFNLPKIRDITS